MNLKNVFVFFLIFLFQFNIFAQESETEKLSEFSIIDEDDLGEDIIIDDEIQKALSFDERFFPTQEFSGSYSLVWKAVKKALDPYEFEYMSKKKGHIRTRWQDNTKRERLLLGEDSNLIASKVRLSLVVDDKFTIVNSDGSSKIRVTIVKEQKTIKKMGQDFQVVTSDGILEKGIFYRVQQLLMLNSELKKEKSEENKGTIPSEESGLDQLKNL